MRHSGPPLRLIFLKISFTVVTDLLFQRRMLFISLTLT